MAKYEIHGGKPLSGTVVISGAKNAAVAIIPAALLVSGKCRIENVPNISDVRILMSILHRMGAKITSPERNVVEIDCSDVTCTEPDADLVKKMRASYYLMGALLGRFGKAHVALPGGCNFASRPIDQHIKGFEMLGAAVDETEEYVSLEPGEYGLKGTRIYLDMASVGATMNIMMAATLIPGQTVIENAAKEPHVVDIANVLNSMGANIRGAGTDVIKIEGVSSLSGGTYSIIPDQIEAGTYMSAVLATGGDAVIKNVIPKHLDAITAKFVEMGALVEEYDDSVRVAVNKPLKPINVKTLPYPGFPTDLQPQIVVLLATVAGVSTVTEGVWDSRFQYVAELEKLGADIKVDGKKAVINGGVSFAASDVAATDLRAGASMVIAGLSANGITKISQLRHIDRGYEHIVEKLRGLGADIERVDE